MPKEPDRVIISLVRLYEFVASNLVSVVIGVVAFIVVLLGTSYYASYRARESARAFQLFYRAQLGLQAERMAALEKVIEDYPRSKAARLSRYDLAMHYLEQGEYAEARELLEQYLRQEPDSFLAATVIESLGFIHEAEGKYQEALARYSQVLEKYPENFVAKHIQLNIGRCHEQLSQWEAARKAYTEVFVADPRSLWADDARQRLDAIEPFTPALGPEVSP